MFSRRVLLQKPLFAKSYSKKVFASFNSYGEQSALQASPIPASLSEATNGQYLRLKRHGTLLLSWAPSTSEGYDWKKKQFFALQPTDMSQIITGLQADHAEGMSEEEKVLIVRKLGAAGAEISMELATSNNKNCTAVLSGAEYHTLKVLMEYSIPYLMGFDQVLHGVKNVEEEGQSANRAFQRSSPPSGPPSSFPPKNNNPSSEWPF